jgi:ribonuclease HI
MSEIVTIYTDGAARGNPGNGGYGAILQYKNSSKEISAGYRYTTNNRMELLAVIEALNLLTRENLEVHIYSDSSYVVDSVEKKWLFGWIKKQFKDKKNKDLWLRFYAHFQKQTIKFFWVKGHSNNPKNNRCDELATAAADGQNLLIDEVYESEK